MPQQPYAANAQISQKHRPETRLEDQGRESQRGPIPTARPTKQKRQEQEHQHPRIQHADEQANLRHNVEPFTQQPDPKYEQERQRYPETRSDGETA